MDFVGPLRPSDSWSTTEVRSVKHLHVWTIRGFSQCECRYLETHLKIRDVVSTHYYSLRNKFIFELSFKPSLFIWISLHNFDYLIINEFRNKSPKKWRNEDIFQPFTIAALEGSFLTFRIRVHPQGNKESNKDFSFFQVNFWLNQSYFIIDLRTFIYFHIKFNLFHFPKIIKPFFSFRKMIDPKQKKLHGYFDDKMIIFYKLCRDITCIIYDYIWLNDHFW